MVFARSIALATVGFLLAACEIEGSIGSLKARVEDASSDATVVVSEPDVIDDDRAVDVVADASASEDASDASDAGRPVFQDARQSEVSTPEAPLCDSMGRCPLARYCSRTLCQPPWGGCTQDEKCNGLDDDCDGVRDNGIDCGSGDPCPEGQARCGGECVDFSRSNLHCGRCDRPCGALMCSNGVCM